MKKYKCWSDEIIDHANIRSRVGRKLGEMADRIFVENRHYDTPTVRRWLEDVAITNAQSDPVLELHRIISERGVVKCQAILDFETERRCLKPATENDERFRYPMCSDCATVAYNCMDVDDAMLANAY